MYSHPQQGAGPDAQKLRRAAGRWLKALRERRQLSQRQLAALVHVEYYTFISQIEAGRGRIPPDRYEQWAHALDLPIVGFVKTLLSFYDPVTHRILFAGEGPALPADLMPDDVETDGAESTPSPSVAKTRG
ncbi:helix-turn-helix transcriptional regulator [Roseospira marina]|uniref:Helix-turn-helix transcriptional regulator n=1 Tax=Roseospira marina TaxID=140057 RepID=A0A5M6IG75_9PROT|nr:helix-turn-helix transcriptional regulator [Roseospira marina]KAA5607263.1 helix-turn-helix transcriptional regulator [Roseospira marina]MBB4312584.1 transcriptional regulator with XRE-family HTH domain [Roseospira marina]MBB5085400.1 transcriptional regulator with XRE-family HTH domain [Roseospira marina]